jgi:hypothetical protein
MTTTKTMRKRKKRLTWRQKSAQRPTGCYSAAGPESQFSSDGIQKT